MRLYLLKLRKILLCNYPYYILLTIVLIISLVRLITPKISLYNELSTECIGIITEITKTTSSYKITIKNKEKLIIYYHINDNKNINLNIGDEIKVTGEFNKPQKNTSKNLFNYQKYLYNKNIHYIVNAKSIKVLKANTNILNHIKLYIKNNLSNNTYLNAFILGDKSLIKQDVLVSYQENGISHLLAISGMHITLLSNLILKLLKKIRIKETKRYIITSFSLLFYLFLIGIQPSALRGILFFILFSINKIYYFYIKPQNIFLIVLSITLLINPFFIYDIGFQYSFLISLTLILMSKSITGNHLQKLLKTSYLSFVVTIPISLYNYNQINILSIIYNLFFVPLVSSIIFPFSIITLFLRPLTPIYNIFIFILEKVSLILNEITISKLIFPKLNIIIYIIYFILIIIHLKFLNKSKLPLLILIIFLTLHYIYPIIHNTSYLNMIDVGQGDSILLHSNNESILIDTGGTITTNESKIVKNTTIPLLKSLGVRELKYLILTHGDADHMGEAKYLIENFKVENIIINSGKTNYLEEELINIRKDIIKGNEELQISCGDFELIQLNEEYQDENTSSQIYYVTNGNINILLTGDASIESELNLLNKYDLPEIDILKVGHHGSKTSSSTKFIDYIKPKYSLISCGKDNKFNHPNSSVLDTLKDSKIYRTDEDGSIMFEINKDKLKIEICRS